MGDVIAEICEGGKRRVELCCCGMGEAFIREGSEGCIG